MLLLEIIILTKSTHKSSVLFSDRLVAESVFFLQWLRKKKQTDCYQDILNIAQN